MQPLLLLAKKLKDVSMLPQAGHKFDLGGEILSQNQLSELQDYHTFISQIADKVSVKYDFCCNLILV